MARKHDLSDMMIDRAYTDKDENGKFVFFKGKVLKFDYEGSPIYIKLTRIDRKNKKMYGEEINLYDFNTSMTHYGHDLDLEHESGVYCRDCKVTIDQPHNEEGEVIAHEREMKKIAKEEKEDAKRDKKRRFKYILFKQDGTKKEFGVGKRKKLTEMYKILDCETVAVIPSAYYPPEYAGENIAVYGDDEGRLKGNERNPHMLVLKGDPDLDEPEEWDVVGDVLAEIEVK